MFGKFWIIIDVPRKTNPSSTWSSIWLIYFLHDTAWHRRRLKSERSRKCMEDVVLGGLLVYYEGHGTGYLNRKYRNWLWNLKWICQSVEMCCKRRLNVTSWHDSVIITIIIVVVIVKSNQVNFYKFNLL